MLATDVEPAEKATVTCWPVRNVRDWPDLTVKALMLYVLVGARLESVSPTQVAVDKSPR
jgi:hypothetical protein